MLNPQDKTKLKTSFISTLVTLLLAIVKFTGALVTSSGALLADSLHSLTDSISSMFVTLGIFLSTRKSKRFPYGLYKVENLVSLIVSFLIIAAGIEIILRSLKSSQAVHNISTGLVITGLSILVSVLLGIYKIRVSKTTNSPSLRADGYHSISDALSSVVVFTGIFLYKFTPVAENIAGVIVAIILVLAGLEILKQSLLVLLDAQLSEEDISKIMRIIKNYRGVRIDFIRGRSSGSHYFIELGIAMGERSLKRAHEITEDIEQKVKDTLKGVEDVVIHYEPLKKDYITYAIPIKDKHPTTHIGRCDAFIICEEEKDNVPQCRTVENPARNVKSGRGAVAVKKLIDEDVDVLLLPEKNNEGMVQIIEEFFDVRIDPNKINQLFKDGLK